MDGKQACILMVSLVPSPSPEIHLHTSGTLLKHT